MIRTVQKRTPGPACANSRNTAVLSCKDRESLTAEIECSEQVPRFPVSFCWDRIQAQNREALEEGKQ